MGGRHAPLMSPMQATAQLSLASLLSGCLVPAAAAIEEEEYCLIPMGGVLPRIPQRVLGIGGTAGMVHPSTGGRPFSVT